ncbi:hypothetical protein OUZ56_027119 [Daphnia magna]|uniref:Metal transporter CNNM2 n=2 Tax=Daphnia magna TaxID=35525 RepID=A0ABQ9ZNV7_9CRUS|nr:hypothetical protein OUZ56_027119 [Daphnia magna]
MTSNGRVYFFPVVIFSILLVKCSVIYSSQVPGGDTLCAYNEPFEAHLHEEGDGIFRIQLCACSGVGDLNVAVVAKSEAMCHSSGVHLEWDRNATIDRRCLMSKPSNFDQLGSLVLCQPTEKGLWKTPIPLVLPYVNRGIRSANETAPAVAVDFQPAVITGLRVEEVDKGVSYEDGVSVVLAGATVSARMFGYDFSNESEFRFVMAARDRGADCDNLPFAVNVHIDKGSLTAFSTLVSFRLPSTDQLVDESLMGDETPAFYICSLERANGYSRWTHQGREPGVKVRTYQRTLPLWIQVIIIIILMAFSGLFSGLNLGLMALDRTELKIYENTGTEKEKQYAKTISPVRNHGNYLLCTLLLGNVLVNNSLTILLDDLTSGLVAIIGSTIGIVIFGEIIPQAICSRYGLAIGAHTVWITKFFMLITFPMSYPISLILDRILGEELGAYYNRERLKELIKVTKEYHDLEKEEVNIIAGALELRRKTVGDIMTRLEDVFMLSYDSLLDFETVSEIMKQGFSRVPIYDGERNNIIGLLFIKELALVDPQDAIPLKTLCRFYKNQCNFIFEDTTLDIMFKVFKEGHKGHMAFVQRVNCQGDGDPFYETVGLVTLEDIIEELIQAEIVDETDVWMDNRSKRRREKGRLFQDFSGFALQYHEQTAHKISPQLALAAFQFLSSSIDLFKPELISTNVLRRLMQQSQIIRFIRVNKNADKSDHNPAETFIFQQGKPADYFVLILEGRVEVTVGKENLIFESGPFSHYGSQALMSFPSAMESASSTQLSRSVQSVRMAVSPDGGGGSAARGQTFVTDYTVRAVTDVVYFCLSRVLYQAARSATVLERTQRGDATKRISDCDSNLEQVIVFPNGEDGIGSGDQTLNENSPLITQGRYCTDYLMSNTTTVIALGTQDDECLLNGPSQHAQSSFPIGDNPEN